MSSGPAEYVDWIVTSPQKTAPRSSGTGVPGAGGANSWTTPAGAREVEGAGDRLGVADVQTKTWSARPPSSLRDGGGVGLGQGAARRRLGQRPAVLPRLHGHDRGGAGRARGGDLQQAHRPGADDGHPRDPGPTPAGAGRASRSRAAR